MRTQPHTRTCSFLCQRRPFRFPVGLLALLFLTLALAFPQGVLSEPLPSSRVVRFAVEKALKGLNVPGVEIVAQGSWISGKNYRDPRFQQLITEASDHDMRLFFRRPDVSTAEALEVWKKFRMNVQDELKALVDRGIINSDELGVLRNSINIYPPEELMKEIQTSEQAVAQFGKWGTYPSLAEVGKEGSGGSYGQMLKFERQGYENTERAIVLYLDKGEVRAGSADLNHMLEGHGLRTPENLAKAAENNLADALKAVKAKNLKDTSKYLKRAKDYLNEAKGKLRTKANPNDQKLLDLEKKLDEMVTKFEEVETRAGLLSEKVLAKTAEGAALQKQIAGEFEKMADDAEKVLSEAADDSLFAQKLGAAVGEGQTSASRLYRGLLEGTDKWVKARPQVRAGLSRLTDTGQKIGFLNALAAYWIIKDLPEIYVKEGAEKATARFGMSLTTLAVPEIALGELVAVIATTVAEVAVDYVGSYGYRAVTSTQDCFDLIAGFYTVYGREAQVLGEGLKKCHQVNSVRALANDIYDKDDLRGTVQRTQKLDGRLIPSELNSMIACHAENASKRFDEETKADKGVEEALIAKCTGPIVAAWLEERELAIEEVQVLVSDVERSELRVGYDTNAAVLKKGSTQAQVTVSAQIIPALGDLPEQIKTRMQGPGGKGSKPSVYQNVTWKLDGSKVTSGSALSYDFTFDKPGMQSVCAEWEMQYDVYNTPSTLAPTGLSGKVQRTGCVDVVVTEELEADKLVVAITGPNKAKAPEKGETGRKIPLVAELTSKRDPKEFQYVWTAEGGFSEAGRSDDRFQTFEYGQPGTYTIKVEIYDASDTWKVKEIKRAKLAEATHKITIEPSVKDAKIELKVSGPKEIVLGNPINLSVEVVAEERIKAKLKPPVWFMGRGRVIFSPDDDSFETTQTGRSIGQGATASYTPLDAGTYDFSVNVFGEGVSGPAASGSQRVEVNCRVVGKDTKCKDEGAPAEEKLSVMLIPDRTSVASGETVNVNAVAQGGTPVYRFTWAEPAQGDGPSARFVASPTSRGVRVEVKDGKGQTAQGSVTIAVDKPPVLVEGLKDKVLFGTWLDLRVPVEQGNYVRWQSSPTVSFKPEETSDGKTTVTFDRMDKVKVWAEIMAKKGEVSETVNSSDPVDVMVNAPDVKIEFDPSSQVPGKEVTAEVKWGAYFDTSLIRYVWLTPPTSNREEVLPEKIRFKVADRQSIPVEVEVRAARSDQTVVSLKRSFDPDGKSTPTEVKTGDDGTASKKKQEAAALVVKAKESVGAGRLDEGINQAGEAIKLDPAFTEAVNLEKKWKAEKQTVAAQVEKTNQLIKASRFDEAEKELNVAKNLHPKYQPVADAEKLLKEQKEIYGRTVLAARERLGKAKEAAGQGRLAEAVALADEAAKLDAKNTEASSYAARLRSEQAAVTDKAQRSRAFAEQENFVEAERLINEAKQLHPKYQPVVEADAFVATRKAAYTKKVDDSNRQLDKAKQEVHLGKLDDAIASATAAVATNSKNADAAKYIEFVKTERQATDTALGEVKKLIDGAKFPEAQTALIPIKNKYSYYPPAQKMDSTLSEAWSKWEGRIKEAAGTVHMANERKEFAKSLELVKKARAEAQPDSYWSAQLTQDENWARRWETEKEQKRKILKSGEEKLKSYDYAGACKAFEEGFQNSNNLWAMIDPEPNYYGKLQAEATAKQKRLDELMSALRYAAEQTPVPPGDVLERALKTVDEAAALQPPNGKIKEYRTAIEARLGQTKADNTRTAEGQKYLTAGRSAENSFLSQESYVRANPNSWGENIEGQMQSFLEKAIENYTASLKYIPDTKVEQRIKELKTALDGRKKYLENVRLSKKVRTEGDQLIKEARSEQSFEASQDKFSKGLDKYKESLKLYSPPDVAILNQTIYAVESDKQGRIVSKYRADGEALEREGRIVDALAAYQKAYASYHVSVPQTDRMQLQVKIQELTNRINGAKTWRAQGETQQKQGKVAEAITSYEQSLKLVPDKALEEHVKLLRAQVTKENDKKVNADKLWQEGTALFNQGRPADALAKFKESLAYWQDATRTKYVQDLEGRRAQAQTLRDQGAQLQQQNRLQDAVAKYNQSLQLWPDSLLADHIKALEAKTAKDNEQKNTADKLWKEGTDVLNQGNPSEALAKFKESLKYSSSPDRVKYVQDLEARKTQAEKLRSEGASLQSQGKLQEAIGKYKESLKYWPDPVLVEHIAKIEAEMKKQQTPVVTQPVPPASGPVDGTWEVSFNNYKGKMELQRSGSGWSGRIWLDAHQRWEQLTNVSYSSSTGRMEFTRPISGATQRYSGALSAERMEGTFTQENSSTKYTWWAKRTQAGTDKPVGSNATTGTSQSVVSPVQPGLSLDGTYSGPISGAASGTIQITVAGDRATGTINGTYQGDRFNGSWTGTVSKATGEVQGALKGDISGYAFTGSIAGRIQGVQATGTWNAKNQYGNPTGTWQAARGGGASSTGTSTGTGSAPQGKTSVMAELTNSSKMNAHIFTEGETFSPSNRLAPGEKRKVSVQMAPNGTVTFKAGRDGQVMATKRWDGEPGNPNRVPVVIFDDTNPFDKLTVATGLR